MSFKRQTLSNARTALLCPTAMVFTALAAAAAAAGDGHHARIYGYTNGRRFGIRKATGGDRRRFRSASPVRTHFEVCTYERNVPLRCTTKWTTTR